MTERSSTVTDSTVIESLGVYLPEASVSTASLLAGCIHPVRFPLEQLTGIGSRRTAADGQFSIDLAVAAVADCLRHSRHAAADIDLVIACNISRLDAPNRVSCEPGTAFRIRRHFGFGNALAFDISNACAGMFTGVLLADALIRAGAVRRSLVFSGEYITHLSATAQQEIDGYLDPRLACLTVGDAGAAVILERSADPGVGFQGIDIFTLGKYSSVCIAKPAPGPRGGATMVTDPMQAAALGLEPSAHHAARLLRVSGWPLESVAHIVPHQISSISINEGMREIGKLFGIDVGPQVINNLAQRGNTASNTHFVALMDQIRNHRIQAGDRALFCIAGSGISVGTALYRFDDLPDRIRRQNGQPRENPPAADAAGAGFFAGEIAGGIRVGIAATGFAEIPGGPDGTDTRELNRRAADDCLKNGGFDPRDVELVLGVGMHRSEFVAEPAAATMVADDLEMNHDHDERDARRTLAFDLLNGPFLNACHVACQLIAAGRFANGLIVASECPHPTDPEGVAVAPVEPLGSATLLQPIGGNAGFERFLFRSFPEHIDAFSSALVQDQGTTYLARSCSPRWEDYLIRCIAETSDEFFAGSGISLDDVAAVLPPQISRRFVHRLAEVLSLPRDRMVCLSADGSDRSTSSIPLAFDQLQRRHQPRRGDLALLVAAGAGIQVGCSLYRF
jgi:3-oxoacyl-[acyl-carrier-protein] synthase III